MASIVLTGIGANYFTPGNFLEINFAQGAAAGSGSRYSALLIGNRSTAGSATVDTTIYGPDTQVPAQTETDVITLFGNGSPIHRGWRRFTKNNKGTSLYMLAVTESAGVAATGVFTITGPATSSGTIRTYVVDDYVDTTINSGDSATTIAAAIKANVNAKLYWPVTGNNAAGVFTYTAKVKGPRGNFVTYQNQIISGAAGVTTTNTAQSKLSAGATLDSSTTALATILYRRFYWILSEADNQVAASDTQFTTLVTQVNSQALPASGIRQRAMCGSTDTLANCTTVATTINAARAEIPWYASHDWTPFEVVCHYGGIVALETTQKLPRPLHNFNSYGNDSRTQALWTMPAARAGTSPTPSDIESALHNGFSPIAANANGSSYLVKRITTRSLSGATADYRVRDAHKVDVCDMFGDDLLSLATLQYPGKDIQDNPKKGELPNPQAVWPDLYRQACVYSLIDTYQGNGQLQAADVIKANVVVQRETNPTTRMSSRIPLTPIDVWDQNLTALDQVG